jgi:HD superfamily phosphohydrolase YqeK
MFAVDSVELPPWAQVSASRRAHIARVAALIDRWAGAMEIDADERAAWHDAALGHDALRDAPESELRALVPELDLPSKMLHGPAAARRLADEGELRSEVLEAIRWHTVGNVRWGRTGRALYMADYLEPGRSFDQVERAYLAAQVPHSFDDTFRQVVRHRLEWWLRDGKRLAAETVILWNSLK